jgi:cell division protein FtsB
MQIVFGSILAISLLLAINFSGRIAAGQRIQSELNALQATITRLQLKATQLHGERAFINSDAYIEQWARGPEGNMAKPGEKLVRVVPGQSPAVQVIPTPVNPAVETGASPDEVQNWQLWWQLFFDSPPPGATR